MSEKCQEATSATTAQADIFGGLKGASLGSFYKRLPKSR